MSILTFSRCIRTLPSVLLLMVLLLAGCSLPVASPIPALSSTGATDLPVFPTASAGEIRFINLVDGSSIEGSYDELGRARLMVQVEVSGVTAFGVSLTEDGIELLDEMANTGAQDPFLAEIPWYPMRGGGEYTLGANALLDDKSILQKTIHITVTGIPAFTATPPPLDQVGAQQRISGLIQQEYGISIPLPTVFRFDDPLHPYISRWIGAAYYRNTRPYINLYDDTHYNWSTGQYADSLVDTDVWILCKPAGHYKVLVLYVDYANLITDQAAALTEVQTVVDWLNSLYTDFARTQGLSASPLIIEAEAAYIGPPPISGDLLTADQVRTITGKDPAAYNFLIQIDVDPQATFGTQNFPGVIQASGGGLALQGCGKPYRGAIHIWSAIPDASQIEGVLVMDFNHELSHIFGLVDDWPAPNLIPTPSGQSVNDWIPYPMFGWTDVDGDRVIEIIDPTPYGTTGPQP